MKSIFNTPQAKVILWNYKKRLTPDVFTDIAKTNEVEKVDLTNHVINFQTTKAKSSKGTFQIQLDPSYNWQGLITTGSWIVLMATNRESIDQEVVNPKSFLMIGKITDVRYAMQILDNGARASTFYISGEDWSAVFDTKVYFDPALMPQTVDKLSGPAQQLLILMSELSSIYNKQSLPTTSDLFKGILGLFSSQLSSIADSVENTINVELAAGGQLLIPTPVLEFLQLESSASGINFLLGDTGIKLYEGNLSGKDQYSNEDPTCTLLDLQSLFGTNSFLSILQNVGNVVINEMFPETHFNNGKFEFALYKRCRPFCLRDVSDENLAPFVSRFDNLPFTLIPDENIRVFSAGTNNQDRYNFIEVMPAQQFTGMPGYANAVKNSAQVTEPASVARDGFKPMIVTTKHVMMTDNKLVLSIDKLIGWKNILKEWYWNSHGVLNGSISFIGVNDFIGVGQNILFTAKVLGGAISKEQTDETMILAHVESIQHHVSLENSARSYYTTVNFVRAVLADSEGKILLTNGTTFDETYDNDKETYRNLNTLTTMRD